MRNPRELELLRLAGATFADGGYDILRDALLEGDPGPGPLKDGLTLDATMRDPKVAPTPAMERQAERLDYLYGATWKHAVQAPTRALFRGLPGHCVRTATKPNELGRPLDGPMLSLELGPKPAHELTSLVDSHLATRLLHLTVWGRGAEPMEAGVLVSPAFASLDSLHLPLTQEVLAALAGSPRLGAIKSLRLTGGSVNLSTNGKLVARLCELPLASLEMLTLTHMPLDARGLAALATGPAVSSLAFERCDLADGNLPELTRGHLLAGLTRLRFARDTFSDQGLATVLGACQRLQRFELEDLVTPHFDHGRALAALPGDGLRSLGLNHVRLTDWGLERLPQTRLQNLESLTLRKNELHSLAALRTARLPALRELSLVDNRLDDDAVRGFLRWPLAQQLTSLDLRHTTLSSPIDCALPNLRELRATGNTWSFLRDADLFGPGQLDALQLTDVVASELLDSFLEGVSPLQHFALDGRGVRVARLARHERARGLESLEVGMLPDTQALDALCTMQWLERVTVAHPNAQAQAVLTGAFGDRFTAGDNQGFRYTWPMD